MHPRVPPTPPDGAKVRGIVTIDGADHDLISGERGHGEWFFEHGNHSGGPTSGRTRATTHVEGHAAGLMRKTGAKYGSLSLNKKPCGPGRAMCRYVLNKLLAPGQVLDVTFFDEEDDGRVKTWRFIGGVRKWKEL